MKIKIGVTPNNRPKSPFKKPVDPNAPKVAYVKKKDRVVDDSLFNVDSRDNWLV